MNADSNPNIFEPWSDPQEKPFIKFSGVTKRFGDFTAVDNVDLEIYQREFFALLGPSGCGKTTLMRMLGGFETVTEGTITIDGQDMASVPPNKRAVNMMFQSYALFPHLTVEENIAFGLKRSDMNKKDIAPRVEEMINLVQLNKFAKRKPHQISGGQKQRVALARALAKAPKLLLLDEPLGALDKKLRQETQFELMDIQEKTGTTFVIVTHDQEEAMTVASRVAVMDNGMFVQIDTPNRIYEAPNCAYVADFIGDVNLIKGSAKELGEEKSQDTNLASVIWAEGETPIIGLTSEKLIEGQTCAFAIRPEKVALTAEKPRGVNNAYKGKVHDIAYLGNISTFKVRLDNDQMVLAQVANNLRISGQKFTWEDEVWVSWADNAGLILTS